MQFLIDTNFLLRIADGNDPLHVTASETYVKLVRQGHTCCFSPQNATEFWSVATRRSHENGFGLSKERVNAQLMWIERSLRLLIVTADVCLLCRNLLLKHDVRGKQVHDAMLAAISLHHRIDHIITWNAKDFKRFEGLTALTPDAVLAGALQL